MHGDSRHRLDSSRFDPPDQEPLGPLANLVDIMLVFACGLIAALAASQNGLADYTRAGGQTVEQGKEIPEMPVVAGEGGAGYESVGKVYRDKKTGKLILIGEEHEQ
ncbi:MAG: DUF2149 domain-containing protein [Thiohalophilus sp.]|uniref:DUF2149 domain-containing protein n=1 Tax=Thiohalophilus sp. TaxID=3028392 RepID=UPI0028702107|nr:DUF2149 domain-containing protein [Thiohalophilus sp.]MDR9436679.1 DUF2149 domain-containing protein [Thiohalophilus sp.]